MVPVVQLVRASDCGSECRGFESHRAPQKQKRGRLDLFSVSGAPFLGTSFYFADAKGWPPAALARGLARPNTLYVRWFFFFRVPRWGSIPCYVKSHCWGFGG